MGDSKTSRALLRVFTALVVVFLFAPIAVMIVFSFNDPAGRQNITWQGFTFENYIDIWSRPQITGPMVTSLAIAAIATVLATTFGTMIALALSRYEFRGRGALNLLIFIPMAAPEIILGASLLTMWISIGVPARLPHDPDRPRDVQHQLRDRHPAAAPRRLQPTARGGRHGPLRQ